MVDQDLSDHPTTPGRSRADRRREGLLDAGEDPGRRRPPPRPVPAAAPRQPRATPPAAGRSGATPPTGRPNGTPAGRAAVPAAAVPRAGRPAAAPTVGGPGAAPLAGRPGVTPAAARAAAPVRPVPPPVRPTSVEPAPETRVRLPLPPAATAPAAPAAPAGPRTTVAPFQAVPRPDPAHDEPASPAGLPAAEPAAGRSAAARTAYPAEPGVEPSPVQPSWGARSAPAPDPSEAAPGYRDWTSPSRTRDVAPPATTAIPDRSPAREHSAGASGRTPAPDTTAIPDRTPAGRSRDDEPRDVLDDTDRRREPEDGPWTGTDTGVVGGRAAFRAERQAAEAERRKAARRSGGSTAARPDDEDGGGRRRSGVRRAGAALLAIAVVALLVLGVHSFAGSDPKEASTDRTAPAAPSSTAAPAAPSSALPPLEVAPLPPADAAPAEAVRAPVTVLNATGITGLAADVAGALGAQGWESPGVGQYQGGDVAVTTVYFTRGDETQRQAAVQLIAQFPQITGPVERFFEVPGVAAPGLVVVTTGEWRP